MAIFRKFKHPEILLKWIYFNFGIDNRMSSKVWDEMINPFPHFNGYTAEVWEWINNFTPIL